MGSLALRAGWRADVTVAASAQHVQPWLRCRPGADWRIVPVREIATQPIPRGLYMVIRRATLCLLGYTDLHKLRWAD
jgi:hypothetical protein